ncbi:MAG: alpha/beta hydrolase [Steroidobacteraceae bacterium]
MVHARPYVQGWFPEGRPVGSFVIAHGLAEHGGRYATLAAELNAAGWAVHAIDHAGHGHSAGRRADIGSMRRVVDDLAGVVRLARENASAAPVVLFGHSMGGLIALKCALELRAELAGLVLSAPALDPGEAAPAWRVQLGRLLAKVAPGVGMLTLPAEALSRDPAVVQAYERDPLVYRGSIPVRTLMEMLVAMQQVVEAAPTLQVPVLIQHGTADRLVSLPAVEGIYQRLGEPDRRTLITYPGLYHEIYNEPERVQVVADLLAWLKRWPARPAS